MWIAAFSPLNIRFQDAWWLLLVPVLLVPAFWSLRGLAMMSPLRRWVSVALRAVLVTLIASALAGLALTRESDRLAVVAVVDVSDSVRKLAGSASLESAGQFLEAAMANRMPDDVLGVVAVSVRPTAIASPTATGLGSRSLDVPLGSGTNLEAGLRLARAMLPPDARSRLVLISDGNQTTGDVLGAARAFASSMTIDVLPVQVEVKQEARIESVDAPQSAAVGANISVRVVLSATSPTPGTLRLLSEAAAGMDPELIASRRVVLPAGRSVEVFDIPLGQGRVHRFLARLEPDPMSGVTGALPADTILENNEGRAFTITPGQGRVLLIEGEPAVTTPPLVKVLTDGGFVVDRAGPASAPADVISAQAYDLIILDNAPADAFSPAALATMVTHVRDLGGGLVMLGGRESFGAGGYKGTVIEPLLPVNLDLPERLVEPESAVILVLDNSGSMMRSVMGSSRSQQAIANEAAAAAVMSLDKRDLAGVIVFNSSYTVLVPLGANVDPRASAQRVLGISSDGGTDLPPALEEAAKQLAGVKAKSKSIIVLTDGISIGQEQLSEQAAAIKKTGVTVSTIAVGDDADKPGMKAMAEAGGGTFFDVRNPMTLPRILVKAVRVVRSPLVREQPFSPVVLDPTSPFVQGLGAMPPLGGLSLTQPRTGPTVSNVLASETGDPVLASWNVELGRVAAFTSNASQWAGNWLGWPGYRKFWLQLARATARSAATSSVRAEVIATPGQLTIRAALDSTLGEAAQANSEVQATVYGPDGRGRSVQLSQVGPGQFEGATDVTGEGTYFAIVRPKVGGRVQAPTVAGATINGDDEFRKLRTDNDLLQAIATSTGGRVLTSADADKLFDRGGVPPRRATLPLWPTLLPWILAVAMADIASRRIAWDRWLTRQRPRIVAHGGSFATLERLREAPSAELTADSITLGSEEAKRLVQAARDRRREERLRGTGDAASAQAVPSSAQATATPSVPELEPDEGASELLRAKRRASKRFDS